MSIQRDGQTQKTPWPRVTGFEGVALKDGMGAKGNSQIPGGFYAKVGHNLAEGGEHAVVRGNLTVCHSQYQVLL